MNSGIVRIDASAPELTPEALQAWQRVQVKVPAENIARLSALQSLGFSLVEGEVDFALPVKGIATSMARKLHTLRTFLLCVSWPERRLRRVVFARRGMRPTPAPVFTPSGLNAVRGTFDHQCTVLRTETGAIRGYVSLRELNDTDARIGLLAGRGAGAELMQAAICWAQSRGKATLRVATQLGNTAALKRYIQSGANIESTAYWLYR